MQRLLKRYLIVGYMAAISLDASQHQRFLVGGQKLAVLGKRRDDGPACYADEDSHTTFDDEDPTPRQ